MMVDDGAMYEIIKELKKYDCFAGVHCENADIINAKIREAKAAGDNKPSTHPKVRPDTMEAEAVHRLMVIAGEAKAPVMTEPLGIDAESPRLSWKMNSDSRG